MSYWSDVALFMYGDPSTGQGFWYSHVLREINGLQEHELFWVPDPKGLCMLWQAGHIAHRERTHVGVFLQGLEPTIIPEEFEVFGPDWCTVEEVRRSIKGVKGALDWVSDVRQETRRYIASLKDDDFQAVPPTSEGQLTVGQWLFITAAHTALHIGRIQLLRALIENEHERAC